jgi:hypothetical protein
MQAQRNRYLSLLVQDTLLKAGGTTPVNASHRGLLCEVVLMAHYREWITSKAGSVMVKMQTWRKVSCICSGLMAGFSLPSTPFLIHGYPSN